MGIILGVVVILVTLLMCGWVAFSDAIGNTPLRVPFWVVMACGLSLGALMIASHFLGWGW